MSSISPWRQLWPSILEIEAFAYQCLFFGIGSYSFLPMFPAPKATTGEACKSNRAPKISQTVHILEPVDKAMIAVIERNARVVKQLSRQSQESTKWWTVNDRWTDFDIQQEIILRFLSSALHPLPRGSGMAACDNPKLRTRSTLSPEGVSITTASHTPPKFGRS